MDLGCPRPAGRVGRAKEEARMKGRVCPRQRPCFLPESFPAPLGTCGEAPSHSRSGALSSLFLPLAAPHPTPRPPGCPLPPVVPRIERAAKNKGSPRRSERPPCVWLCPAVSRAQGQGPRLSRPLPPPPAPPPPRLCPGALCQASLQVLGGEGAVRPNWVRPPSPWELQKRHFRSLWENVPGSPGK